MLPVSCSSDIFEKIANAFVDAYFNKIRVCLILFNNKTHDTKLLVDFTPDDIDSLVCRVTSIEHQSYFGHRTISAEFIDKHLYYEGISIIELS